MNLDAQLRSYDLWKQSMTDSIKVYQHWLDEMSLTDTETELMLIKNLRLIEKDTITIAFAAEFSRGKTELINALFFSSAGIRLLPSSPGRTTMCPTELFYDRKAAPYLRLLDIETRANDTSIEDYKRDPKHWVHIELDDDSPEKMQDSFLQLLKTKTVSAAHAKELGLATEEVEGEVTIPAWRHALVSFPHPLLEKGLTVLDTPGLNALGSEPELTLSMLPNAQAMIFVLAADTGVTQSDMAMWKQYVQGYSNKHPHSLAVVLNKIDTLSDELMSDDEWTQSIHKQTLETAGLLNLDEQVIFPLSAKQGLIGNIKKNQQMISASGIQGLESFLSDRILSSQKEILQHKVISDVVDSMKLANSVLTSRLQHVVNHTNELNGFYSKSEEATAELLLETRKEQTAYKQNLAHLKTSRHIFYTQIADLLEVVNPKRVSYLIDEGREQMSKSWTSVGIRQGMKSSFEGLNSLLNETLSTTQASIKLLDAIYKRFKDEHNLDVEQAARFDIKVYQQRLDKLLRDGLEFSSSSEAALTEQNTLTKRFVNTVGAQAISIFEQAQADINRWKSMALANLIREVSEQKKLMESKLDSLRSVSAGKNELDDKIANNRALETEIKERQAQLLHMMDQINISAESLEVEKSVRQEAI